MTRRRLLGLALAGVCATGAGVLLAVYGVEPAAPDADPGWFAWLIALIGLAIGAWLLFTGTGSGDDSELSLPWSPAESIVDGRPEATPDRHELTGGELVEAIYDAGAVARDERDVDAGVAIIRPLLRETYRDLRTRDRSEEDFEDALDAGTWTDDRVAAAVLAPDVEPPDQSFGQRVRDWLYPGRAVTWRVRRTVDELAALADETVPPVVGQSAPRQVPVHEPSLAARTVGPEGEFPRAALDEGDGSPTRPDDRTDGSTGGTDRMRETAGETERDAEANRS